MKIIFVCIGNFQEYILDNIKNLKLFKNDDIVVITEPQFFHYFSDDKTTVLVDCHTLEDFGFNQNSRLDKHFRNGFWHLCSLRFFYLYSYIATNHLTNCIHLENDVMTYINFDNFGNNFQKNDKLYLTYDRTTSNSRVIPGIVYIPNATALKSVIENYNYELDDMHNLAKIGGEPLPLFPIIDENINQLNINYPQFQSIFDAAAIGQYLGGIDKRNQESPNDDTRGFVNETCDIQYNHYQFFWVYNKNENLYVPHILVNGDLIQINNLHIHSKDLYKFMANNPFEEKYITKILENVRMDKLFDIVIPLGPHDLTVFKTMITFTKKNIIGFRNIYLIPFDPTISIDGCITVNENIFPFNKTDLIPYIGDISRVGWYLQQLFKLYSGFVIPNILDNYLVIDSDTIFLKPTVFFENGKPLYNIGIEYWKPYFYHMERLHPTFIKQTQYSGITHHMVFQKQILYHLIILIETYHKKSFWKVFLESIHKENILNSGASEYEIYFNFLHIYFREQFIIRPLKWIDTGDLNINIDIDYISVHYFKQQK
jgi:hypothetical protein